MIKINTSIVQVMLIAASLSYSEANGISLDNFVRKQMEEFQKDPKNSDVWDAALRICKDDPRPKLTPDQIDIILKTTRSFCGKKVMQADLSHRNLRGIDVSGAIFCGADLSHSNISFERSGKCNHDDAPQFIHSNLNESNLKDAYGTFSNSTFRGATITSHSSNDWQLRFEGSLLVESKLSDLDNTHFSQSILMKSKISNCNISGISSLFNLSKIKSSEIQCDTCIFDGARAEKTKFSLIHDRYSGIWTETGAWPNVTYFGSFKSAEITGGSVQLGITVLENAKLQNVELLGEFSRAVNISNAKICGNRPANPGIESAFGVSSVQFIPGSCINEQEEEKPPVDSAVSSTQAMRKNAPNRKHRNETQTNIRAMKIK